jgi:8-oxo-dGTP pyrophosphatase MutT (NUDIX family)
MMMQEIFSYHWLRQAQCDVPDSFVDVDFCGFKGYAAQKIIQNLGRTTTPSQLTVRASSNKHLSSYFERMRNRLLRFGGIKNTEVEKVLLANEWVDPDRRKGPGLTVDLELAKALGFETDKVSVGLLRRNNVIFTVRYDDKYGPELDLPGGNMRADESKMQNAARELFEETNLAINPNDDRWKSVRGFYSQKPGKTSITRGRHAVATICLPDDARPQIKEDTLGYVEIPAGALGQYLITGDSELVEPFTRHLPDYLRRSDPKFKFNVCASVLQFIHKLDTGLHNDEAAREMAAVAKELRERPGRKADNLLAAAVRVPSAPVAYAPRIVVDELKS